MIQDIPALPASLAEPRPVVITGTVLWIVLSVLAFALPDTFGALRAIGPCGIAVGLVGAAVLTAQRRAARRGDRGAQRGLV